MAGLRFSILGIRSSSRLFIGINNMLITVGFLEFAGVVIWRSAFAFTTDRKNEATGDSGKPLELAILNVFKPTVLMVSFILALLVAVVLTIDMCTASETAGENYIYVCCT